MMFSIVKILLSGWESLRPVPKSLTQLGRYRWCGHGVLIGKIKNEWQDRDYVLRWFGQKQGEAKKAYGSYVAKGIDQGRRPELVGGGLIRSLGGWSAVKAMRLSGDRELTDDRILGSGEFVERIIKEAEAKISTAGESAGSKNR